MWKHKSAEKHPLCNINERLSRENQISVIDEMTLSAKTPPEHLVNRGDAAAAATVETVNRVKKCFFSCTVAKQRYFNLPARQRTDIVASISAQNFVQFTLSNPPLFEYISVREAKLFAAAENLCVSHCTQKSSPAVSSSQVSRKFARQRGHVTGRSRCDWTDVLSATELWCLHVLQEV